MEKKQKNDPYFIDFPQRVRKIQEAMAREDLDVYLALADGLDVDAPLGDACRAAFAEAVAAAGLSPAFVTEQVMTLPTLDGVREGCSQLVELSRLELNTKAGPGPMLTLPVGSR